MLLTSTCSLILYSYRGHLDSLYNSYFESYCDIPHLFLLTQYDYVIILHYLNTYVNNRYLKFIMIIENKKAQAISFLDITRALFRLCN